MNSEDLSNLVKKLKVSPGECEWVKFKHNHEEPEKIGEYVSALSNSAALCNQSRGFLIFGIENGTASIVGTNFQPKKARIGNQELESWLVNQITPPIEIRFHETLIDEKTIVVLEIQSAFSNPVQFRGVDYIRIGSYKKKLKEYPEKERLLWDKFRNASFETNLASEFRSEDQVLLDLDYEAYYDLIGQPIPDNRVQILDRMISEKIILPTPTSKYSISNLGAILFAKDLNHFGRLGRKALRVILYDGNNRIKAVKEHLFKKGYAAGFKEIVGYVNEMLPRNEEIGQALRKEVRVYPEIAIRELVANALIHQDFSSVGNGTTIEIFDNRIEITNPGIPLINTLRFIDEPPRSRNEVLAGFMRRMNICEERGSGIDKVIFNVELYQLPPPDFRVSEASTIVVMFKAKNLSEMSKEEKVRACYQHACLQRVSGMQLTNSTLRKRLGIKDSNYPAASRVIKDSIKENMIKPYGDQTSNKSAKYVPFWA